MGKKKVKKNNAFSSVRLNDAARKSKMNDRQLSAVTGIPYIRLGMLKRGEGEITEDEANALGTILEVNPDWLRIETCRMNIPAFQKEFYEKKREEMLAKIAPSEEEQNTEPAEENDEQESGVAISSDSKNADVDIPYMRMDVVCICAKREKGEVEIIVGERIKPGKKGYRLSKKVVNKLAKISGLPPDWIAGRTDTTGNKYIDVVYDALIDNPDFASKTASTAYADKAKQKERLSRLIRDEREKRNITNLDIANEAGLTSSMLSSYALCGIEKTQKMPFTSAARLGIFFGEDPRYIMGMDIEEVNEPVVRYEPEDIDFEEDAEEDERGDIMDDVILVPEEHAPEENSNTITIPMTEERAEIYRKFDSASHYVKDKLKNAILNSSIRAENKTEIEVPKENYFVASIIAGTNEADAERLLEAIESMISIDNSFGSVII